MIRTIPITNHSHEWPIVKFWYTKHTGWTIEELIDKDTEYFEWAVNTFQDVTPQQAAYYHKRTGRKVPEAYIRNVEPYLWQKGDGDLEPYMTICRTGDLKGSLLKYRGKQYDLFE